MKIVCSWCRQEGKEEFVGEKAPFDDARETHGICLVHHEQVQARWRDSRHRLPDEQMGIEDSLSQTLSRWVGFAK
ncbi:hypothetical protein W02_22780 [Nitrospira sp. KM1]|nr:hypothetical protein W02_22780 [Nitrospira sp. KM1]